ncbi:MAG: hypothetical protein FWC83_00400 [Alphaproteobacteria bacterium]|nr:hypothetical protein [Alphaproteobacteria bacterium]
MKYKLVKENETTNHNHNSEYFIKNYLTKDFDKKFSIVVVELTNGEHEPTKNIASDRFYYFISADATFEIEDNKISINDGDVLFIEKDTFFSFKGSFRAVQVMMPAFNIENDVNLS